MTRLSRGLWWSVLATAVTALLLSLVVIVRGATAPAALEVDEVRGSAAVQAVKPVLEGSRDVRPPQRRDRTVRRGDFPRLTASPAGLPPRERVVRPARLRVPSVGLDMKVRPVGVGRGGQMWLPPDPRLLGWYRFGPAPGSGRGSAVLAGHVDSRRYGIGPLASLAEVAPGSTVRVVLARGRSRAYRIDSIERFDRQRLPAAVFTRSGPERLRLVTCTGAWVPEAGGYEQNLVVTAVPVRAGNDRG